MRRKEAAQSVLVQVNSEKSYTELETYCTQFGHIHGAHHYAHQDDMHYILLEYSCADEASAAIRSSTNHEATSAGIVVQSPFLWFRAGPKPTLAAGGCGRLRVIDGNRPCNDTEMMEQLKACDTVDAQMRSLHRATSLNDLGIRLRFLAARQIEQALSGMFPQAQACPFGSSVNGFGRLGCDLDLILRLSPVADESNASSRLVYHTKENLVNNGRPQTQRQMETISDLMQLFLPGVCHVRRILQARVPIIKYHHEHLDLEVDLSMSNL